MITWGCRERLGGDVGAVSLGVKHAMLGDNWHTLGEGFDWFDVRVSFLELFLNKRQSLLKLWMKSRWIPWKNVQNRCFDWTLCSTDVRDIFAERSPSWMCFKKDVSLSLLDWTHWLNVHAHWTASLSVFRKCLKSLIFWRLVGKLKTRGVADSISVKMSSPLGTFLECSKVNEYIWYSKNPQKWHIQ